MPPTYRKLIVHTKLAYLARVRIGQKVVKAEEES